MLDFSFYTSLILGSLLVSVVLSPLMVWILVINKRGEEGKIKRKLDSGFNGFLIIGVAILIFLPTLGLLILLILKTQMLWNFQRGRTAINAIFIAV